jgi:glucose-6-phosphate-specific signal transduction histidine kinase
MRTATRPLRVWRALGDVSPQAGGRGGWLPTLASRAGLATLLVVALAVADERSGPAPYSLVVVSVLLVLCAPRPLAVLLETRRLHRRIVHIEQAAEERRQLLIQLLARSVSDRRRAAEQMHEQALAAYASFVVLFGAGRSEALVAQAAERVRGELERHARSLHDLVLSIRPPQCGDHPGLQPVTPVPARVDATFRAYLDTVYGDENPPRLDMVVADELVLDWMVETVLLQIVQEALHNVWRHSHATEVGISIELAGLVPVVRIIDNGVGFHAATAQEGGGIPTMRAAAAVVDGRLSIHSSPGEGTTVVASLGPDRPGRRLRVENPPARPGPDLRLVTDLPDDTT